MRHPKGPRMPNTVPQTLTDDLRVAGRHSQAWPILAVDP